MGIIRPASMPAGFRVLRSQPRWPPRSAHGEVVSLRRRWPSPSLQGLPTSPQRSELQGNRSRRPLTALRDRPASAAMRVQTFGSATPALIFSLSLFRPPGLNQTLASRLSIGGMSESGRNPVCCGQPR
jgi:hypothetical protein